MTLTRHAPCSATLIWSSTVVACLSAGCAVQSEGPLISPPLSALSAETEVRPTRSSEPSLTEGFDRRDWPTTVIEVPSASVAHQPTYVTNPVTASEAPRTPEAALATADASSDDVTGHVAELVIAPTEAVIDLVIAPVRMVLTPPWATVYGPDADPGMLPRSDRDDRSTEEDGS